MTSSKKRCDSRRGVRNRLKTYGYIPPLPAITFTNVRSIRSNMDELSSLNTHYSDYRQSSLLCFTVLIVLTEQIADVGLDGYNTIALTEIRLRPIDKSYALVNKKWAIGVCIRERISTRSYEMLTLWFWPHYLPCELGQVAAILMYIPDPNYTVASERVAECYNRTINRSNSHAVFVVGEFSCDITSLICTRV